VRERPIRRAKREAMRRFFFFLIASYQTASADSCKGPRRIIRNLFAARRDLRRRRRPIHNRAQCREPEVRTTIAANPIANFGFKAALES
jgi:hypothetical protein